MTDDQKRRQISMRERAAWATKVFGAGEFKIWKPDWNTYRHIPKMPLWHAVALSCDIDPDCFMDTPSHVTLDHPELINLPEEFQRRTKIAVANLGEGLHPLDEGQAGHVLQTDGGDDDPSGELHDSRKISDGRSPRSLRSPLIRTHQGSRRTRRARGPYTGAQDVP